MAVHYISGQENTCKEFKEFSSKDREKIAEVIDIKRKAHWLSPVVEDYIYGTTRALDFGDYYGKYGKGFWEAKVNKNADYFDRSELEEIHPDKNIPRYLTFRTAALYKDHQSKSFENAIGLIFDSVLIPEPYEDGHVTCLFGLDIKKAPNIARTMQKYADRVPVSMGCSIKHSISTCCGKKIVKEADICNHLKYNRGGRHNGVKIAEILKGVDFYELSVVSSPACTTAYVIDTVSEILPGRLLKVANETYQGQEIINIMNTVHRMITDSSSIQDKKRLANQLDQLIYRLECIA
jgi:hypothetical protein